MPKRRANGEGNIRKRKDGRWEGRYTAGYDPESGKRIIKNVLGKTQAYAFLRCFRPGFSVRGSQRGSKRDPRFQFAAGRMPSYNKAATAF